MVGVLGLLVVAGGASYLAVSNDARADQWQERSTELERNVRTLNRLLVNRTARLNKRVRQLNVMAAKVKKASAALVRSESDVQALEERQRELANEKAQIEDERGLLYEQGEAIAEVASAYIRCNGGLNDLVDALFAEDHEWINRYAEGIFSDCDAAEDALQSYQEVYE